MKSLAVIAGIGGINAAGRSSAHHGYRRTVLDVLEPAVAADTIRSLAGLMRIEGTIDAEKRRHILEHTLVRGLEPKFLDPGNVAWNCKELGARTRLLSVVGRATPATLSTRQTMASGATLSSNQRRAPATPGPSPKPTQWRSLSGPFHAFGP